MRQITPQQARIFSIMNIPSLFWGREIRDVLAGEDVQDFLTKYIEDPAPKLEAGIGFFISGALGSGKTTASTVFLMEPIYRGQITHGRFVESPKLLDSYLENRAAYEAYRVRRILVVDDFGREYRKNMDFVGKVFEDFFRYRMTHTLVTGITSNLSMQQIEKTYGSTLPYLIDHSCMCFEAAGLNRRDNAQAKLKKAMGME